MEWRHYMECFQDRAAAGGDRVALRYARNGEWVDMSWRELADRVRETALGLLALGVREDEPVGILSPNRPEWTVADLAAQTIRAVPTPIHAACSVEQARFIVEDAPVRFLFAGPGASREKGQALLDRCEGLERLILMDDGPDGEPDDESAAGEDRIPGMDALRALGARAGDAAELSARAGRYAPDDRITIIYTSGTTGRPKGVVLRHENVRFQVEAHPRHLPPVDETDVSLCFLPLSHVFERTWTLYALARGATVAYLEDPREVVPAMAAVRPTVMCAVPRFFEKVHHQVKARRATSSRLQRALFDRAMKAGLLHHLCQNDRLRSQEPLLLQLQFRLYDALVLKKIREVLGGRIRFMPCAGAAISANIDEFFFAARLPLLCGYGLTETTATAACRAGGTFRFGNAGLPLPGVEIRIDPETKEVLIRGGNVMAEYHNRPGATKEAFTEDGFFRTGDTGVIEKNGELRITGRLKELTKTSGGRYVAPQALETALGAEPLVDQAMIVADGRKFVSALVVPAFEALRTWAEKKGLPTEDPAALLARPEVQHLYEDRISRACGHLADYEKVKRFRLLEHPFTVEGGELTPTMKVRRAAVTEKFEAEIEGMYSE